MPYSCCVVNCTSGYKSNPEKNSVFQFPKNEILKAKWEKTVPRSNPVVGPKTVVCEKHFTNEQIVRTWESGSGASKIVIKLQRPKLANDAIPSIFPGSKPVKKRKLPTKRLLCSSNNEINLKRPKLANDAIPYIFSGSKPVKKRRLPTKSSLCSSNNEVSHDDSELSSNKTQDENCFAPLVQSSSDIVSKKRDYCPEDIFLQIFANPSIILLPKGWESRFSNGKNKFVTFCYLVPYFNGTPGFVIKKQLSFGKEMIISCKIYNKLIDLNNFGIVVPKLPSVKDISNILSIIDGYKVCVGGPCKKPYLCFPNSIANFDFIGQLRHKKCPYLLHSEESKQHICLHCLQLSSAYHKQKKKNCKKLYISKC